MDIGNQISMIRKENQFTQEEFGQLFHVTRQTVSNWENRKSYPDLQTLIDISNRFHITMDTLLKGDTQMVQMIDRERILGKLKRQRSIIGFFTGSGTGIVASCLFSPASTIRTIVIFVGFGMLCIGWYKKAIYDKKVLHYLQEREDVTY